MTYDILKHSYENFEIPQRKSDGFVNLTRMANAYEKRVYDFIRLAQTEEFLSALSLITEIPVIKLTENRRGRYLGGTWAHKQIAIIFAQWLDPFFGIWATEVLIAAIESSRNGEKSRHIVLDTQPNKEKSATFIPRTSFRTGADYNSLDTTKPGSIPVDMFRSDMLPYEKPGTRLGAAIRVAEYFGYSVQAIGVFTGSLTVFLNRMHKAKYGVKARRELVDVCNTNRALLGSGAHKRMAEPRHVFPYNEETQAWIQAFCFRRDILPESEGGVGALEISSKNLSSVVAMEYRSR